MKIFFTVSRTGINKFEHLYDDVFEELRQQKVSVEATYKKSYLKLHPNLQKMASLSTSEDEYRYEHDKAVRSSIFRSDAVVIEASYPSFRLGFEAYFALSQQKPVLVLSKFQNYSHLINQPNFFGAKYTQFTLPDEIEKFIKHVRKYKLRNRFNLFISDEQKKFLEKVAKHYGVSMSDYIRKIIDKDLGSIQS